MSKHGHLDFIRQIVEDDIASGKHGGRVLTRFPPEPNGFLHIGHASAVCLNFGVAAEYGGRTTLRMDDTNPTTEDPDYVDAIARDIAWLGFEWEGGVRYASDYFGALYKLALQMIKDGLAYVDSLSETEIREYRGTVKEPSRPSPYRDRSIKENLDLFKKMRDGAFQDGEHVLRAKIDLAAPNMKMRDPLMYRIRHASHYRTGNTWPIYPFYDWAHGQSDGIEGITHSICTLEFQDNRELYDWFIEHTRPACAEIDAIPGAEGGGGSNLGSWNPRPRQYEFARRNLDYTVVSKRRLLELVREEHVAGWDDPRMPTIAGMRRRGIPAAAIRTFCGQIGVGKADNRISIETLDWAVREALNLRTPRVMGVLDPLRVVIENYPEGEVEWLKAPYFPQDVHDPPEGWPQTRKIPFSRTLYIECGDFSLQPPARFQRLTVGREVRLRHGYFVTCTDVIQDETGTVTEVRCTYDPDTREGSAPDGRKPSGTIHWVSADHSVSAQICLYDRLFSSPDPMAGVEDFSETLNPNSLEVLQGAQLEPSVVDDPPETTYQFERVGYFVRDQTTDSGAEIDPETNLVFTRTVALRDTWGKSSPGRHTSPKRDEKVEILPLVGVDSGFKEREKARASNPILKAAYDRFTADLKLTEDLADLLSNSEDSVTFYEDALATGVDSALLANWVIHEVRGVSDDSQTSALKPEALGALISLVEDHSISRAVAKTVLTQLVTSGGDPREIVEVEGLGRIADVEMIRNIVAQVVDEHPSEVKRFQEGQISLAGFFVGQVMKATNNRADPAMVKKIVEERLHAGT